MALSITGLGVSRGARAVLSGIDLTLAPGRLTAILGPNGSGKSSLVKAVAGLLPREAGNVTLDGQDVAAMEPRARARAIGYLPQDGAVHWDLRADELVALGRLPHRSPFAAPSEADRAAIAAAMAATGTQALAERGIDTLSGGERARVLLARALAGTPRWLLADEPLASLDPVHQIEILDQLRTIAAQGMGVVVVLHDLVHAARAADDVLLLREGRMLAFGPAAEVLTPDLLREAFGVEVLLVRDETGRAIPIPIGRTGR